MHYTLSNVLFYGLFQCAPDTCSMRSAQCITTRHSSPSVCNTTQTLGWWRYDAAALLPPSRTHYSVRARDWDVLFWELNSYPCSCSSIPCTAPGRNANQFLARAEVAIPPRWTWTGICRRIDTWENVLPWFSKIAPPPRVVFPNPSSQGIMSVSTQLARSVINRHIPCHCG